MFVLDHEHRLVIGNPGYKARTGSNCMIFLALLIFLYPPAVLGNEAFMPFEKFTVRQELSPDYTLMLPPRYSLEEFEDFSHLVESETLQEKKNEARAGSRIRLNFSRMMSAGGSVDPFERDRIDKWSMLKSLPDTLQNAPTYQDKFESIGKVFEPKVTLSIEF